MKRIFLLLVATIIITGCGHTIYIVRHAEKAQPSQGLTMSTPNDPPLSNLGQRRAEALGSLLKEKNIRHIFSTNTNRAKNTAAPLSEATGVKPELYAQVNETFIARLSNLKRNALVVGHSNTVDDLVNQLTKKTYVPMDLPDSVYDNLYILDYRRGNYHFQSTKFNP